MRNFLLTTCLSAVAALTAGIYIARPQSIQPHPKELHLRNIRQLTFDGDNAEAYFSFDGQKIVFQSTRPPYSCDQIFRMPADGRGSPALVSTGKGRTTCSYFTPDGSRILFSSTHAAGVVISDRPLTDVVPLQQKGADQEVVTQFAMNDVEALGLLKIDFLGLRNLDVIDKAVDLVGDGLDIANLPLDESRFKRGNSLSAPSAIATTPAKDAVSKAPNKVARHPTHG